MVEPDVVDHDGRTWHVCDFRAMGSRCRIVAPDEELARRGWSIVDHLEQAWTRFRDDSELSQVNRSAGRLCLVSEAFFAVLVAAETARDLSGGRFDVRCLDAVEASGYTRSWDDAAWDDPARSVARRPALGQAVAPLELFGDPPAVIVPQGCRIDLGGIGKGFAADLVVEELRASGAERVQVELGGDIRVAGSPWRADGWIVEVEHPRDRSLTLARLQIDEGAVATSSVLHRRWIREGVAFHHLIDPSTMHPADTDLVAVTAIADTTWRAEAAAKSALIAGRADAACVLARFGATALLVTDQGEVVEVSG